MAANVEQSSLNATVCGSLMFCPFCGKSAVQGSEHCWNCGRSLTEVQSAADASQPNLVLTEEPAVVSLRRDESGDIVVASPVRIEDTHGELRELVKCNSPVPLQVTTRFEGETEGFDFGAVQTSDQEAWNDYLYSVLSIDIDVEIWLFQGKPRAASNRFFGVYRMPRVSAYRADERWFVDVTVEIDIDGVLNVSARDGRDANVTVTRRRRDRVPSSRRGILHGLPRDQKEFVKRIPHAVIVVSVAVCIFALLCDHEPDANPMTVCVAAFLSAMLVSFLAAFTMRENSRLGEPSDPHNRVYLPAAFVGGGVAGLLAPSALPGDPRFIAAFSAAVFVGVVIGSLKIFNFWEETERRWDRTEATMWKWIGWSILVIMAAFCAVAFGGALLRIVGLWPS